MPSRSKGSAAPVSRTRAVEEAEAVARLTSGPRRSIAMVAACPFPSHQGTQVFIRHLANALAIAGHAVHLITYGESEPLAATGLDPRVAWYRAPTPAVGLRSGPSLTRIAADATLLAATTKLLAERDIDVLHAHNVEGLAIGSVASQLTGVPLVYHAHTRLDDELPLYARTGAGRAVARLVGRAFEQLVPRSADAVICFDGHQAARFKRAGVSSARLHVVPLGLAMDELATGEPVTSELATSEPVTSEPVTSELATGEPVTSELATGEPVTSELATGEPVTNELVTADNATAPRSERIIYAGNPDAYQNLSLLRSAFAELRQRRPHATLCLISNHPRETFGPLASEPGVEHQRFDSPQELARAMRLGTVGVVTRTVAVGAPVKALSYLSAGLRVVACATGAEALLAGFPEVCTLTDAAPAALAQALDRALAAPPLDTASLHAARRAFDITDQIASYEAVYLAVTSLPAS